MSNTDNLIQRLRRGIDRALTFSDDVVDDRAVPFDDLVMRDRALAAFDAELRLSTPAGPLQQEGEQGQVEQALRKKRARRIIDVVIGSPCIIETRFFSQSDEQEKLENQVAGLLAQLEREQLENEIFQDATDSAWMPPTTPSAAAMRAARAIVDYLALPDSQEPADSDGSPTNYIAKIITRHESELVIAALNEARELVSAVSTVGRHNAAKYPKDVRADCVTAVKVVIEKYRVAATPSPETPVPEWSVEHPNYEREYWSRLGKPAAPLVGTGADEGENNDA